MARRTAGSLSDNAVVRIAGDVLKPHSRLPHGVEFGLILGAVHGELGDRRPPGSLAPYAREKRRPVNLVALVRTALTPHNLPANCSNDRADECSI